MPPLPIRQTYPLALGGSNGHLPESSLARVVLPGGVTGKLHPKALTALLAMFSAGERAGFEFTASSSGDLYRDYAAQKRLFESRYRPAKPNVWGPSRRLWNGVWYSKLPNVAAAAVPGTSNHGEGRAIDVAVMRDGQRQSVGGASLSWLLANAAHFDFSWELQSEPWHLRYLNTPGATPIDLVAVGAAIEAARAEVARHPLQLWSTGNAVKIIQEKLAVMRPGSGVYDFNTVKAVESWQRFWNLHRRQDQPKLAEDGIVGPMTWGTLFGQYP